MLKWKLSSCEKHDVDLAVLYPLPFRFSRMAYSIIGAVVRDLLWVLALVVRQVPNGMKLRIAVAQLADVGFQMRF